MALANASDRDFQGSNRRPPGVSPEHLKIINDTALRSRLIGARIAEGLQSPKGPQKIASIIRLYPAFDAPIPSRGPKRAPRGSRTEAPSRAAYGLPTIEELHVLLQRIGEEENAVSMELNRTVNADIERLKREIGSLEGSAFDIAFRQLETAVAARKALGGNVREEAFRRIEADGGFAPRKYLRLISRESAG